MGKGSRGADRVRNRVRLRLRVGVWVRDRVAPQDATHGIHGERAAARGLEHEEARAGAERSPVDRLTDSIYRIV